jgi:uncharacterized protein (DUF1778 family)
MENKTKRRRPPLSFRANARESALIAEAAQLAGVSRSRLIRNAAVAVAVQTVNATTTGA